MEQVIRKIVTYQEDILIEGGKAVDDTTKLFGVAAVLRNPWFGRGFVADLKPEVNALAPVLGRLLSERIVALAGSGEAVQAYGKAAVVGTGGEVQHGAALIHTLRFGNHYRKAVGATSYLSFTNIRGAPGCEMAIPMMHKDDAGKRSHYLTLQFSIGDAPAPDEIVVALGASIGGFAHHRIGDRYQDLQELGGNDVA